MKTPPRAGAGTAAVRVRAFLAAAVVVAAPAAFGQEAGEEIAQRRTWTDQADLGLVYTKGNAANRTFSFDNVLTGSWEHSTFTLRAGMYEQTSKDRTRFAVGTGQEDFVEGLLEEDSLDARRLYVFSDFRRDISERFFWQVGANWDKDVDAGIESRFVGYAGVGNVWWDGDDFRFSTDYAISYTTRQDQIEDPDVDGQFLGSRIAWNYLNRILDRSVLTNDMTFFLNVDVIEDYRFINTTALTASMSSRLSIRLSAEYRYSNLPALEEIDLYDAYPGLPGSSVIGTVAARKKKLDSIYRATIVLSF